MLNLTKRATYSLRRRGLIITVYKIYYYIYGFLFDLRRGTNTTLTSTIESHGFQANYGTGNFPAHPSMLRAAFRHMDIRPEDILLDIGCGKGRALIIASEFPFNQLIGIDIVNDNVEIAQRNMEIAKVANAQIILCDAIHAPLPKANVWLFFKPFGEEHLIQILKDAYRPRILLLVNTTIQTIDGYTLTYHYQHSIYPNFQYRIFHHIGTV